MRRITRDNHSTQLGRLLGRTIQINTSFPTTARWKRCVPRGFPQEQYMKLPLWRRRRREEELEEEIQSHLRMAIRDRMERGEGAKEAALAARREFGNVGVIKETTRGMWGLVALETFWQDLRYGARMLLKQPGYTLMAILTLSLGIGANTAIFSVVNAALLRPPVAAQPERLLRILKRHGNFFSFPNYRDLAEGTQAFSMLAAH